MFRGHRIDAMHVGLCRKGIACISVAATLMSFGTIGYAQEADSEEYKLEEVIVTAEKRETNLQKTPVAVTVVKGSDLAEASATEFKDLAQFLTGVTINAQASFGRSEVVIRGVTSVTMFSPSDQPSTAVIVDGLYGQSGIAAAGSLFDVQQVEVTKGPQGTLIGRNATAGAVMVNTQKPKLSNEAQASTDFGNYGRLNASGLVNIALSPHWAVRLSAQSSRNNGFYKDRSTNEDTISGRLGLLFEPNEDVSVLLRANYRLLGGKGATAATVIDATTGQAVGGDPWLGPTNDLWVSTDTRNNYGGLYGHDAKRNDVNWGISPEIEWKLGSSTLTVLTGYQKSIQDDVGLGFNGTYNNSTEKSLETRLASNRDDARLKWLAGLYYYRQDIDYETVNVSAVDTSRLGPVTTGGRFRDYDLSKVRLSPTCTPNPFSGPCVALSYNYGMHNYELNYALFTQETYAITDSVRLTGGGRWQYEKTQRGNSYTQSYSSSGAVGAPTFSKGNGGYDWRVFTWKAGVDVDIAPKSMVYFMISTGWKAGAPQPYDPPYDQQYPEKLTQYALGSKNRFLDDTLQLNGEIYLWDYRNRQQGIICYDGANHEGIRQGGVLVAANPICNNIPGLTFVQANAKKSHVQGASLDVSYRPLRTDTVSASVEYTDEAFHDDLGGLTWNNCSVHCALGNIAKWSTTLSWRHMFDLGQHGRFDFDFRTKYETKQGLDFAAYTPIQIQEPYHLTTVGLAYSPMGNKWSIRAYVDNLEDALVKYFGSAPFPGTTTGTVGYYNPRTYGVQLRGNF